MAGICDVDADCSIRPGGHQGRIRDNGSGRGVQRGDQRLGRAGRPRGQKAQCTVGNRGHV